jgi:hypothetical protein
MRHVAVCRAQPPLPCRCQLFAAYHCCHRCNELQVGNRWEEFSDEEHRQLATMAYTLLQQGATLPLLQLPCRMAVGQTLS